MNNNNIRLPSVDYRTDIDGLRAIAVMLVVGYHAFPKIFKGGFIGVDIFFVISGYLISKILLEKLQNNTFNILDFYSHRIRRIFPALIIVLIACFFIGWLFLFDKEYQQLSLHIAAGAGFISNFLLWSEGGYFDNSGDTKPLLHLWSLGIEQQFYLIWPLILWFSYKKSKVLCSIALIGIGSFFINILYIGRDSYAIFYSPQTRFWELMLGSLLAYVTVNKSNISVCIRSWKGKHYLTDMILQATGVTFLKNHLSAIGIFMISAGTIFINSEKQFPGWWALLPSIGAFLIIGAGTQNWINRKILSGRLLVWIGLISYPLYLWHWPLLSFLRIDFGEEPPTEFRLLIVFISVLLAWLTYSLLERPLRIIKNPKIIFGLMLPIMIFIGITGYINFKLTGVEFHTGNYLKKVNDGDIGIGLEYFNHLKKNYFPCTPSYLRDDSLIAFGMNRCFQSKNNSSKQVAVIGDSHAEHLFVGFAETLDKKNVVYYTQGTLPVSSRADFRKIFEYVLNDDQIKFVLIAAYWVKQIDYIPNRDLLKTELLKTINSLNKKGKKVYVIEDVPNFNFDTSQCKFQRILSKVKCQEDRQRFDVEGLEYKTIFSEINNSDWYFVRTSNYFCDKKKCSMALNGSIFYRDRNHLNIIGSRYVAKQILSQYPDLNK